MCSWKWANFEAHTHMLSRVDITLIYIHFLETNRSHNHYLPNPNSNL